jgi:hypothetical protein
MDSAGEAGGDRHNAAESVVRAGNVGQAPPHGKATVKSGPRFADKLIVAGPFLSDVYQGAHWSSHVA